MSDKATGKKIEPDLPPSIGIVEDPALGVSGPLWVRGGIPIESAGGKAYEARNRLTRGSATRYFFSVSAMPHVGQFPGLSRTISGCIEQV